MNILSPLIRISSMTMISRILGFMRDILIAASFGAGGIADAFFVAIKFPNLFRRVFAEGALNVSFVPLFTKKISNPKSAKVFYHDIFNFLFWVLILIVAIFELFMPLIIYIIAPGFIEDNDKFLLVIDLARIAFPYLFFISLVSLLCGVLNSFEKFTLAASLPIFVNLSMIIALLYIFNSENYNTPNGSLILMWSFMLSGFIQLLLCIYACHKLDYAPKFRIPRLSNALKGFLTLSLPAVIAGGVTQINILVGSIIASFEDKAVSFLYYADRVYQLPLALIGISIGIILLPQLTKKIKDPKSPQKEIIALQNKSLELAMLLAIPATFGLIYISHDVIKVLFERYLFDSLATLATGNVLMVFSLGLPAFVSVRVIQVSFFARENTKSPMSYAIVSVLLNILLSIILFNYIGYIGIAISTTIASWANLILLYMGARRKNYFLIDKQIILKFFKIILASTFMIIILHIAYTHTINLKYTYSGVVNFLILLFYVTLSIVSYSIICEILNVFKFRDLYKMRSQK
tara:strand:- start:76021 stop:77577 length:1557 start_codon:yes stop_codon:yes gene_type:complete